MRLRGRRPGAIENKTPVATYDRAEDQVGHEPAADGRDVTGPCSNDKEDGVPVAIVVLPVTVVLDGLCISHCVRHSMFERPQDLLCHKTSRSAPLHHQKIWAVSVMLFENQIVQYLFHIIMYTFVSCLTQIISDQQLIEPLILCSVVKAIDQCFTN